MSNKLFIMASEFKAVGDANNMEFTCYGNTKNFLDHAGDVTKDGAFVQSIKSHKARGTMPKMFFNHDRKSVPVGKWIDMVEDVKGLLLKGVFANTEKGREMYELMKMGALDSFSIGYAIIKEHFNGKNNELVELDIKEVSIVTFACNEESRLLDIKSKMAEDEVPTKRELEKLLRESGLSRKEAAIVCSRYDDQAMSKKDDLDIFEMIARMDES